MHLHILTYFKSYFFLLHGALWYAVPMSQAIMSRVVNASIRNANCKLSRATTLEFVIDKGALVLKQFEINYAFQEKSTFTSKTM